MASSNTNRKVSLNYCDLYNTPTEALDILDKITYLDSNKRYFDPCAGKGVITEWIKHNVNSNVESNELFDHGYNTTYKENFLETKQEWDYDVIIQNPPYKLAKEFVLKGFGVAREQWVFCRLDFLTSKNRLNELWSRDHLKEVHIFSYRVSCTKGVDEEKTENSVNYAWFYFDTLYSGDPVVKWI